MTHQYMELKLKELEKRIVALEQKYCEDAISREAVRQIYREEVCRVKDIHELEPFINRIENLPTVEQEPKWIPVSERMPEFHRDLYCNDYHSYKASDNVLVTVNCKNNTFISIATYTNKGWVIKGYYSDRVIAWMPFPEPYESESEG